MARPRTSNPKPRDIERQIRSVYNSMPGSERALADRVLEYPNEALLHSATELAALAGASKAAVSRFVKRLGYSDFREMQREIRQAQMTGDPIFLTATPRAGESTLDAHLEHDLSCLRQTIDGIDAEGMEQVAQAIIAARRVVCLGYRNSYFFAAYVRRQLFQIRRDVMIVPSAGQMVMEDISDLGPDDLLIAIGNAEAAGEVRRHAGNHAKPRRSDRLHYRPPSSEHVAPCDVVVSLSGPRHLAV